jgi:chemotaxis signal transduction protein
MTQPHTPPDELRLEAPTGSNRQEMESVWRQRAARLASRSARMASPADEVQVIVLRIGAERYGVELTGVAGVLPPVVCTPVPGAPQAVAGIIAVHGEIRPVLDLRRMLGIEQHIAADAPAPVVLLHLKGRQLGLQADRVEQIRSVNRGACRQTGDGCFPTRYVESLTDDTLMLLKTEALFAELAMGEESAL